MCSRLFLLWQCTPDIATVFEDKGHEAVKYARFEYLTKILIKLAVLAGIHASELTQQMYADAFFHIEITSFSFLWNGGSSCRPFHTPNIWIYEHATHIFVWGGLPLLALPLLKLTDILGNISCLFPNVKSLGALTAKRMLMGYFWEYALSMENTGAKECMFESHLSTLGISQSIL